MLLTFFRDNYILIVNQWMKQWLKEVSEEFLILPPKLI